jgi:hypothetical protein
MIRIKRFYLILIFLIILLPVGENCYARIFSARHFCKKNLFDKVMILNKCEIDLFTYKPDFMENVFNQMDKQSPITDGIKYVSCDIRRRPDFKFLKWDLEIKDKTCHIYVNRYNKTVTIGGEAEDREEKEKVEQ